MLSIKIRDTGVINADGNRVYLEDITGAYNATTNPTGYGGVNPSRNTVAIILLAFTKSTNGDIACTVDSYDPLVSDKFSVLISGDGWYQFSAIALPIFNPLADLPPLGTIIYNKANNTAVKIVDEEGTNFRIQSMNDLSSKITSSIDRLFTTYSIKTQNTLNKMINDLIFKGAQIGDKLLTRYQDNYDIVRGILQGTIYEYNRGNKYMAQKNLEFLNSNDYIKV